MTWDVTSVVSVSSWLLSNDIQQTSVTDIN